MTTTNDVERLYNFDLLKELSAENPDFIKSLAQIFLKTTPADCASMMQALKQGDWSNVSKYAHKMKSTIDSMNILSIKNDIRTLETDAKHKVNLTSLPPLAVKVEKTITTVAKQLKEEFGL